MAIYIGNTRYKAMVGSSRADFVSKKAVKDKCLTCTYDVVSTGSATALCYTTSEVKSMTIDGVAVTVAKNYTFATTGEHIVEFEFTNTTIPQRFFYQITTLTKVEGASFLTALPDYAFRFCSGLVSVDLSDKCTTLGTQPFFECTSLASVGDLSGVITVGTQAFYKTKLVSIDLSSAVTISHRAFMDVTTITSLGQLSSVVDIQDYSIRGTSITTPVIGANCTNIGVQAFLNCTHLLSVTIYATTPPTIGTQAFYNTNNCVIYVPSGSVSTYQSASGWSTYASRIQAIPT